MFGSQRPPVVTRAQFADSGFTAAHLSDTRLFGYADRTRPGEPGARRLRTGEPFVYAYWDDIDRTAHEFGLAERYNDELAACDAMVAELLHRLPAGTAVVVTADHGQVHVGERRILDLPAEVTGLVDGQSGEARFRWLHSRPGARLGSGWPPPTRRSTTWAWVRSVDEVVSAGWLGDRVVRSARGRLGDVAVVARDPVAIRGSGRGQLHRAHWPARIIDRRRDAGACRLHRDVSRLGTVRSGTDAA